MKTPEQIAQSIISACADCDTCRFLMDSNCLMFPKLYRLYDQEVETGEKADSDELRRLVDLCSYCALCPCPNIREDLIRAKTEFVRRDGLNFGVRTLEDVARLGKLFGLFPRLAKYSLHNGFAEKMLKSMLGVHDERKLPQFAVENFDSWLKNKDQKFLKRRKEKSPILSAARAVTFFPRCPRQS